MGGLADDRSLRAAAELHRSIHADTTQQPMKILAGIVGLLVPGAGSAWALAWNAASEIRRALRLHSPQADAYGECQVQATILREVMGNPFRPLRIDPAIIRWNDETPSRLARVIYEEQAFDQLPILADALEEAGCTDPDILDHCRQPDEHVRGCWLIDALLGKTRPSAYPCPEQKRPPMPEATKPANVPQPTDREAFRALVSRAQKGDEATVPELRKWLQNPATVDFLGGDLARQAELSLLNAAAGENLAFREAALCKMELMRADLAGPASTPLERLLVERIIACWLQLHYADIRLAQSEAKLTMAQVEYQEERRDRAHKRYLSAIKTLVTVRKLALPVVQVNIARKQVNMAGPCLPIEGAREAV
jgi:hypothetical protein